MHSNLPQVEPADRDPEFVMGFFGIDNRIEFFRLIREGRLPAPDLKSGRYRRWRLSTLNAWLSRQQEAARAN
jgi:hypothetical protein